MFSFSYSQKTDQSEKFPDFCNLSAIADKLEKHLRNFPSLDMGNFFLIRKHLQSTAIFFSRINLGDIQDDKHICYYLLHNQLQALIMSKELNRLNLLEISNLYLSILDFINECRQPELNKLMEMIDNFKHSLAVESIEEYPDFTEEVIDQDLVIRRIEVPLPQINKSIEHDDRDYQYG